VGLASPNLSNRIANHFGSQHPLSPATMYIGILPRFSLAVNREKLFCRKCLFSNALRPTRPGGFAVKPYSITL
jgi:hypothetical protein